VSPVKHLVSLHDAVRIKRSVCHAIGMLLVALWLCFMSGMYAIAFKFDSHLLGEFFFQNFPQCTLRVRLGLGLVSVRV